MEETKETQAALSLLEDSQGYLRAILLGIALQYRSLDIERCLLLGNSPVGPTRRLCRPRHPLSPCVRCSGSSARPRASRPKPPSPAPSRILWT